MLRGGQALAQARENNAENGGRQEGLGETAYHIITNQQRSVCIAPIVGALIENIRGQSRCDELVRIGLVAEGWRANQN